MTPGGTVASKVTSSPERSQRTAAFPYGVYVGSGEHAWTAVAPLRRAETQRLSLTSRLAQIIDDPEGYRVLVDVLSEMDTAVGDEVRHHTAWITGRAIGELLERRAPAAVRQRIADEWEALNTARGIEVVDAQL